MFITSRKPIIHFIGIGGIGMSGIAEVLYHLGYEITGSDISLSQNVMKLQGIGCLVEIGHKSKNISNQDVIVVSSAIDHENPEIIRAKELNIPIIKRAEMLAELMRHKLGIAIAGTHGKTTTTSILSTIMAHGSFDPTFIIGGIVKNLGGHAKIGSGKFVVVEADESDGSFLLLSPVISVITNIDDDHLEHYGSSENLDNSFIEFANKIPFYGFNVLNMENSRVRLATNEIKRPVISVGISCEMDVDYRAVNTKVDWNGSSFDIEYKGTLHSDFKLRTPGLHNIQNALCAIAVAHELEMDFDLIRQGLKQFETVGRRFEKLYENELRVILDDYAHHPTEIMATLKALRNCTDKAITVYFEPHRFSRTRDCWKEFLHCFNYADNICMLPIYAASENEIEGINSDRLVEDMNTLHPGLAHISNYDELKKDLRTHEGVIITLGAGAIGRKIRELVDELN